MNLFEKQLGEIISTKKLSLQGQIKIFDVYRIPLEFLRYNKKNGRIATYVSQYIDEGNEFPKDNLVEFNDIIENYIERSNPDALKKTKRNIQIMSQTEPAVVLSNGIVLDGNRRFTSLRQLSREGAGAEFNYLEAVILDERLYTEKDIKRLELNLQHAVESRVDYNPIDRLVDIYRDLISDKSNFTVEEYSRETHLSIKKVKDEVELAQLMLDYLEYINQPLKFYIARDQKIDGPLREVQKIIKSSKLNPDRIDDAKEYLFLNIMSLDGDITRKIRELKQVLEDREHSEKLFEVIEEDEILDDANDYFESDSVKEKISEKHSVEMATDLSRRIAKLTAEAVESKKLSTAKVQPIEILEKSYRILQEVDKEAVERMGTTSKQQFLSVLRNMSETLEKLNCL